MRDIAHTPMIPALSTTPAWRNRRFGRRMTPTAHPSWSHATAAKKLPCNHDVVVLAADGEVDDPGTERQRREQPAQVPADGSLVGGHGMPPIQTGKTHRACK